MTGSNSKFRAVVLAALMVLSVFAGTVAFTGSAAAASGDATLLDDTSSDSYVGQGGTVTVQTVNVSVSSNTAQVDNFTVDLGGSVAASDITKVEVTSNKSASGSTTTITDPSSVKVELGSTEAVGAGETAAYSVKVTVASDASVGATMDPTTTVMLGSTSTGTFSSGQSASAAAGQTTTIQKSRKTAVSNRVFLGEEGVDLSSVNGGGTTFTGVAGDADGDVVTVDNINFADITNTEGWTTGGYDHGGYNGADTTELTVSQPQITTLELYLTGKSTGNAEVTGGTVPSDENVYVFSEFNFNAAEDVEITVEDDDGLDVTDSVVSSSTTASSGGWIVLDGAELDTGEYTVTIEGAGDLDSASQSTTFTVSDQDTTISVDQTTVTKGDSVIATVSGDPGTMKTVRIAEGDLADSNSVQFGGSAAEKTRNGSLVFANTDEVSPTTGSNSGTNYVYANLDLGDDGQTRVRIKTDELDTGSVDVEVADGADALGANSQDDVTLTINEQKITVSESPNVVAVGEDFMIEGSAPESDEVAAYAKIDNTYKRLAGDENPYSVDDDGSFALELTATSPINIPDSYRIGLVNEEAWNSSDQFPMDISSDNWNDFDTTGSVTVRTQAGELTAQLDRTEIAADVGDQITVSGTAIGQKDDVRIYRVSPRGAVSYQTANIDDQEWEQDFTGFVNRGTYTFVVVSSGRDQSFEAGTQDSPSQLGITGEETREQAVEIIRDGYEGAGVDDNVIELTLQAQNPQLSLDDFTTDGQVAQEEVTISGSSNREADTTVFVEVLNQNDNSVTSASATVGNDGSWNATIDFSDVETGTYTLRADDDESSVEMDFEVVESISTPTETPEPETETATATPEPETETATATPEPSTDTATETTTTSTPGFGAIIAVIALIAAALLAIRRD